MARHSRRLDPATKWLSGLVNYWIADELVIARGLRPLVGPNPLMIVRPL
jgi:hypothetical protein